MSGIVNVDVGGIVDGVAKGLDDLFTSDEEKAAAKLKIQALLQQPHILQAMANIESAKSTNWFVAGARPALLWTCCAALGYHWMIKDFIVMVLVAFHDRAQDLVPLLPSIDSTSVTGLVMALLGLAGVRMAEKLKGVARDQ